jgi:DNA-binding protein YbaB
MPREIDDAWVEEAIDAYRRIEERQASYARALSQLEVSVRSPDGAVEIVVGAEGRVRRVQVTGSLDAMSNADLARAIEQATSAAHDAAQWARRKLYDETFGEYRSLGAV